MNRLISYYRARYFSPQIGRFLTRDPLGSPLMMGSAIADPSLRWNSINTSLLRASIGTGLGIDISSVLSRLLREPLNGAEVSQGPNLYWYVRNQPTSATDPLGLFGYYDEQFAVISPVPYPGGAGGSCPYTWICHIWGEGFGSGSRIQRAELSLLVAVLYASLQAAAAVGDSVDFSNSCIELDNAFHEFY